MMDRVVTLVGKLVGLRTLSGEEFIFLLGNMGEEEDTYLYGKVGESALANYGSKIHVRGLVEFISYYKSDCYCHGVRRSNQRVSRYRLSPEQIMECCRIDYGLEFRTFVLQGGEDSWFADEKITYLVECIKRQHPDCAVTLSVGEKGYGTHKRWFDAGADRYLFRHETANPYHYASPHPSQVPSEHRKECLHSLKAIGYQTDCGTMAGSPYQITAYIVQDLELAHDLQLEMVRTGPSIPHHGIPFKDKPARTPRQALLLPAIVRLILPDALPSATTALGTIEPDGREQGMIAGTNVAMPSLSPLEVRKKYMLCDNKISMGVEAAANIRKLKNRMASIGYEVVTDWGDHEKIKSSPCP